MPSFRIPAAFAVLLVVGLIAGCGGGDSSSSTAGASGASGATGGSGSSTTASTGDYASQVGAALATFNKAYIKATASAANPASANAYVGDVTGAQDAVGKVVSDLNAITPPQEDATFHKDLIASFTTLQDGLDPLVSAAKDASAGNAKALLSAASDFATETKDFQKKAIALGAEAKQAGLTIPNLAG